jgi:hypothetical protein
MHTDCMFSLLCLMSVETVCYFFILWSPIVSLCCWGVVVVVIVIGIYSYLCNQCASLQTLLVSPLKIGGEFICSERVSSSCSTSGTRRVNLVTHPVINHERGKDMEVITTSGTYRIEHENIHKNSWKHPLLTNFEFWTYNAIECRIGFYFQTCWNKRVVDEFLAN